MPRTDTTRYTFLFATAICVACALLIAVSAVGLHSRQEANALLYRQKNVLLAAGLAGPDEDLSEREILKRFDERIGVRLVDLATGALVPEGRQDAKSYDQRKARNDPAQSRAAPANPALVSRLPHLATVYLVNKDGRVEQVVLPIEGMGMWGTLYGFIALGRDGNTVRGLTFYEQKETPGLGGEIGNPRWQALWLGRKVYDANWEPALAVIKGTAGKPDVDPNRIDGLSGATITSNGVSRLMKFWMSQDGWAPFLRQLREGKAG
ncbi:MAG: Na(+)-translocating NADH-quinone reductase subunit C [Betaproteobacteria bacterium]